MKIRFLLFILTVLLVSATVFSQTGWTVTRKILTDKDLNTVYFSSSERGWMGGDQGLLNTTKDGGKTWVKQSLGTTDAVNDIYFRGSDKGYVLAGDRVYASTDGGNTWREERVFKEGEFGQAVPEFYSLRFANKKKGWIVGSISENEAVVDSLVLQTTDGGESWQRVTVPTKAELIHVDFVNEDRGWIVGYEGTILSTQDGGVTWRLQTTNTKFTIFHVDFKNDELGWAVGEKGLILRTEDGGRIWETINSNITKTLLSVEFVNDKDGWIVGRGGTILRSGDGGRTWLKQDSKTTEHLFALYIEKKYGWAVGSKGVILKYDR